MPNGKIGDHPITDMLIHGRHPFPDDIEQMLRKLIDLDPAAVDRLGGAPFDWERGKHLDQARTRLRSLLARHSA